MKYCSHCGGQIYDEAVICINCGCKVEGSKRPKKKMYNIAKIFMVISCVYLFVVSFSLLISMISAFSMNNEVGRTIADTTMFMWIISLFPFCWLVPMTKKVFYCSKTNGKLSTGFKICTLLFVNMIAGILLLCENAD